MNITHVHDYMYISLHVHVHDCIYMLYIMLYKTKIYTQQEIHVHVYVQRDIHVHVYIMYTHVPCIKVRQWCPPQAICTACLVLGN